jgi:hypothetical protein
VDPDDTIAPEAPPTIPCPPPSGMPDDSGTIYVPWADRVERHVPSLSIDWDGFASEALDE